MASGGQRSSSKVPRNWPISKQDLEEILEDSIDFIRGSDLTLKQSISSATG